MLAEVVRDAAAGQLIRYLTGNKYLQYPDEREDFVCPASYSNAKTTGSEKLPPPPPPPEPAPAAAPVSAPAPARVSSSSGSDTRTEAPSATDLEKDAATDSDSDSETDKGTDADEAKDTLAMAPTIPDMEGQVSVNPRRGRKMIKNNGTDSQRLSRIVSSANLSRANTRADLEDAYNDALLQEIIRTQPTQTLTPTRTADGRVLVDWYATDDPENPQNWTLGKKTIVVTQVYLYTLAVYIASAIYTPSIPDVIEIFGVSSTLASLGLSIYVAGYGWGPLIFSPLSEIPLIGRNPPYVATFFVFFILSVGTSVVNNWNGFIALRFFQGFFGSPALATGGASIGDLYSLMEMPYYLTGWAAFATAGPAIGPIISGFSVPKKNWHWSMWEVVWLAAPILVSLFFFLPETSSQNILLRRARRLRKLTGNQNLVSQSEIDQSSLTVNEVVVDSLWRPVQINALDPSVLFTSVYIGLLYGIFYSFFEAFPLVYGQGNPTSPYPTVGYGMNLGQQGLIFLSMTVGVIISIIIYIAYLYFIFGPSVRKNGIGAPEQRLVPGLFASIVAPMGLFIFAWTAQYAPRYSWAIPTCGIVVFIIPVFILFQVIFVYIPMTYPAYSASLFAGNDVVRSSLAAGAVHFAHPLFHNLGIARGVSLLGGLTVIGVIGIWTLWLYGGKLRAMSKFAAK